MRACWQAMPPVKDDTSSSMSSPAEPQPDASAAAGSNTEAEGSAAHIAELVRRTSQRDAGPAPASVAHTQVTIAEPRATPTTKHSRPPLRPPPRVLVGVGAIAVALIVGGFALWPPGGSEAGQSPGAPAAAAAPAAPAGYEEQVTDEITDCATHARGRTKAWFRSHNCVQARRSLGSGRVQGRPVLFVVSRIEMRSDEAATSVKRVLDGIGTGNLNDLLREGKTFPGAPEKMPDSGYASVRSGSVVLVTEAGFADGGASSNDDPALRTAAAQVAAELAARS